MEFITDWARQIAAYLIFESVLSNFVRKQNYLKYVRLIMGIILMILLAVPAIKLLGKSEDYQFYLSRYLLTGQAQDSAFIHEISEQKAALVLREVEAAIQERIVWIVTEYGTQVKEVKLQLCTDEAEYGKLKKIHLVLETNGNSYKEYGIDSPQAIRIRERLSEEFGTEKSEIIITIY